ncbi:MAG: two-component system response regulator CreB [Proteobacteria bacterium]|nr:two-component system response regulator CreB [Pseudomonadota bacterium]
MASTILIIEDEAEIADTLRYAVDSEGMQSIWASQGRLGLAAIEEHEVDLVILDVGLPDCNGFELLKKIRLSNDLPVMMLTARSDEVDKVVGLEIGADDYVTKPFSPREVVARIKAILKRSQNGSQVQVNGFELNETARKIKYRHTPLALTRSEYILLTTLIARPGQIFSRRQLIEHIWSDQHPSDDRIIDTHVKAVRAKLHKIDPACMPIVTHRGFGYALELD